MATPVYSRPGRNPFQVLGQRGYMAPFIREQPAPTTEALGGQQTVNVQAPMQAAFASPAAWWNETQEQGGGWGGPGAPESAAIGTMSPAQRAAVGAAFGMPGGLVGMGLQEAGVPGWASSFAGLLSNAVTPTPGPMKMAGMGILGADKIANMLGVPSAVANPYAGLLNPEQIAQLRYYSPIKADEAQAKLDAVRGLLGSEPPAETGGWGGLGTGTSGADPGEGYGGWGGLGPGTSGAEPGAEYGGGWGGGGGGSTGNDAGGGIGSGEGGGGAWAHGGVSKAQRGPKRATYGEAGPETALFVPERMMQPGMQGKEREVRGEMSQMMSKMRAKPKGFARLRGR